MENKKIKVGLYGGIGRVPLRAEVITCDHCESCDLYKKGYCLRVTAPFASTNCKYGHLAKAQGYTERSYKYHAFEARWKADEAYGAKLKRPSGAIIANVGDYVYISVPFVCVDEITKDHRDYYAAIECASGKAYLVHQPFFSNNGGFILKEDIEDLSKNGLLYRIFNYVPRTLFENAKIENYQSRALPDFVMAFKRNLPELAERFFKAWPDFDYSPNYVGKKVYVNTLPKGIKIKDLNGNEYIIGDGVLTCEKYQSAFLPFDAKECEMTIKLDGSEIYEIKDNSEVGPDTKIVGID